MLWAATWALACRTPAPVTVAPEDSGPEDTSGESADSGDSRDSGDTAAPDTEDSVDTAAPDTEDSVDTGEGYVGSKALCVITQAEDIYANGTINRGYRSQVDDHGNLLLKEYLDASLTASTRVEYGYDAADHVIEELGDLEADGIVDIVQTWTYDASGNVLTQVVEHGSARYDYAWAYTYDADGHVLTASYDGYGDETDGIPDVDTVYAYDSAGNLLSEQADYGADGTVELTITRSYDASGNLLSEAWDYEGFYDSWGTPYADYDYAYTYDAAGNLLTYAYDYGSDGAASVWTYTYDGAGNMLTRVTDYGDDGVIDGTLAWTYDADGHVLTESSLDDGVWLPSRTYSYDADGHVLDEQVYRSGVLSWYQLSTYDAAGDLEQVIEYDASGDADYATYYTYACEA